MIDIKENIETVTNELMKAYLSKEILYVILLLFELFYTLKKV